MCTDNGHCGYQMTSFVAQYVMSLSVAVVSFETTNGGSGVTIAVSENAGPLVVVLVLSEAVDEEVSVFVIATPITARGLLTYYVH